MNKCKYEVRSSNRPGSSKTYKIVFVSLMLDLLAFTLILPLLPSLLEYYKKNDDSNGLYSKVLQLINKFQEFLGAPDYYHNVLFGGFLGSLFSFLQFLTSPIAGAFSDVYGRKPAILVSLIGISVSYAVWFMAADFRLFVLARVLGGLSKGNISLMMAVITDVSSTSTRASGMAMVGIAFSLAFTLGPVVGAGIARYGRIGGDRFHLAALLALALSLADVLYIACFFKETLPKERRAKSVATSISHAASYINVTSLFNFSPVTSLTKQGRYEVSKLGQVYFIYLLIYSGLEFTLTFLVHHKFAYTPRGQGAMYFFIGTTMALLQGAWVRRIPPQRVKSAAVLGLLFIIPSFILVGVATSEAVVYAGLFLFAVSTSMVVPCMTTLASSFGGDEQKGTVMGVFRSLGALARAIGPVVASVSYWCIGSKATYLIGAAAIIWPWAALHSTHFTGAKSKSQ